MTSWGERRWVIGDNEGLERGEEKEWIVDEIGGWCLKGWIFG